MRIESVVKLVMATRKMMPMLRFVASSPPVYGRTSWMATAPIITVTGASVNSTGSASSGRKSSLPIILNASATLCSTPCGPVRLGPSRSPMNAMKRRS